MNKTRIEFSSHSVNESFARMTAAAFVSYLDPAVSDIADIKTAVSEAVTNAIIHGYEGTDGIVTMEISVSERLVTFTVSDSGRGIEDVERAMTPLYTSKPDSERSGMGFTVMETFMDTLSVTSAPRRGTTVVMTKKL
mgnify:FL=1